MEEVKSNVSYLLAMKQISARVETSPIRDLSCQFSDLFLYTNVIAESSEYFNQT